MSTPKFICFVSLALSGWILSQAAAAGIRWYRVSPERGILEIRISGQPKIQFGLRDDGVVVWKEIYGTNSYVTNSPAEKVLVLEERTL